MTESHSHLERTCRTPPQDLSGDNNSNYFSSSHAPPPRGLPSAHRHARSVARLAQHRHARRAVSLAAHRREWDLASDRRAAGLEDPELGSFIVAHADDNVSASRECHRCRSCSQDCRIVRRRGASRRRPSACFAFTLGRCPPARAVRERFVDHSCTCRCVGCAGCCQCIDFLERVSRGRCWGSRAGACRGGETVGGLVVVAEVWKGWFKRAKGENLLL